MIENLLRLAKEEGGKAFVMNETTGEIFCVMPLEVYREMKRGVTVIEKIPTENTESIIALSEEELLRKINNEIAIWRENQKDKAEIILPTASSRDGVPEIKKIAKDDSSAVILTPPRRGKDLAPQSAPIVKAPILETEEEFFLEMA